MMPDHLSKIQIGSLLLVIALGFTLAIAWCYIWLLPNVFNGHKTYSILVSGLILSYLFGSYIGFKYSGVSSGGMRSFVTLCCGLIVTSFVAYFSLLLLVNVMGS